MRIVYFRRPSNDREDFIEDKIQLEHAMISGLPVTLGRRDVNYSKDAVIIGHGHPLSGFGNPLWPRINQFSKIRDYAHTETFRTHARRRMKICAFTVESIADAVIEIGGECLAKYIGSQKETPLCRVPPGTAREIMKHLTGFYEWELVRVGGDDREVLVQEFIPMHYEYRVFVVNGTPVTGAGCIECRTPLENQEPFDCDMEYVRGKYDPEPNPAVAEKYAAAARHVICPSFEEEGFLDYALDLFLTDDGRVGIVELNPIHRSGMYAIDYPKLFEAIIKCTEAA